MTWIDYKIPMMWSLIFELLKMYNLSDKIINFISQTKKNMLA